MTFWRSILVFPYGVLWRNYNGVSLTGALNRGGYEKLPFSINIPFYFGNDTK